MGGGAKDIQLKELDTKRGKMLIVDWDEATRDKQWEFLHMAKKHGILKKIPNKEKHGLILK